MLIQSELCTANFTNPWFVLNLMRGRENKDLMIATSQIKKAIMIYHKATALVAFKNSLHMLKKVTHGFAKYFTCNIYYMCTAVINVEQQLEVKSWGVSY